MDELNLLLLGDQTTETLASIKNLCRQSKKSPSLQRFLREATDVVQIRSSKLDTAERQRFFAFEALLDLAEEHAKQECPDDLLATVLSYVSRLGELIIYVENDPNLLGSVSSPVHILGLCTGLLPGAAIAAAHDLNDLVKIGIEILDVLFNLALETTRRSKQIEEAPGCWGFVVTGTSAADQQKVIDEFHKTQAVPIHRHAYISVVSQSWTTVSGPPSTLESLFSHFPVLGLAPKLRLPVGAAVHAAHLPRPDVDRIIGRSPIFDTPISSKTLIMSTGNCMPYLATNLRTLLEQMIEDITQNTLRLTSTVQAIASNLSSKEKITMTVCGPTSHVSLVVRGIESQNIKVSLVECPEVIPKGRNIREGSHAVAIVGMSGRFPGSENVQQFWDLLQDGKELHEKIPASRFDLDTFYDASGKMKNSILAEYGCFLENPGHFDARLFNVSPREAAQMDPMQRLLLMSTYEALEMAGYTQDGSLSTDSKRIATYFGQAADDQKEINHGAGIDIYYVPALSRAFAPGRLNHHFKWEGPSYSLDSACASSSSAVMLACASLISRDCDMAVAGGGSILNTPHAFSGLSRGGFLSTTGSCKTFREDADGYCRGEGVGVIVLKRLEDAIADNDNVLAVIKGSSRNYSAQASSITHPHAETQERLYKQVLRQAGIDPNEISYVEMHGTATQAGDVCEMTSVTNAFAKDRSKENPLYVGAVKANIGHGEASAGVSALIKMVMMLKEDLIPPQPGMAHPLNKQFPPLNKMNVVISDRKRIFKTTNVDGKRKMLLNNFDAAGGNTSILIEDAPPKSEKEEDARTYNVVTCSARTPSSLKKNKQRLLDYLTANPETKLGDLAYTTTARRMHDIYRASYPASSVEDIARLLKSDLANDSNPKRPNPTAPIVFTFTGQGSQYAGMGKDLFNTCPPFRRRILRLQTWCDWLGLPSFLDIIVNDEMNIKRKKPVQIQLAIVCLEIALAELWKSWGIQPDLVIGHSLGEYAALCVAGVLSVTDTLYLVGKRAMLLAEKCTEGSYAMLSVVSTVNDLQQILDTHNFPGCEISCINTRMSTVVSGEVDILKNFQEHLETKEIKTTFLEVPFGFHSAQLDPILPELDLVAEKVHFAKPVVPMASTLLGAVVVDEDVFNADYLVRQARQPVNFLKTLQACKDAKFANDDTLWIEFGPNPVCNGMVRTNLEVPPARLLSTLKSGEDSWKLISKSIAATYASGKDVYWPEFHKDYINSVSLLELPTYSFDVKNYWSVYTETASSQRVQTAKAVSPSVSMPGFPTTTLQHVERETVTDSEVLVVFSSSIAEPRLYDAIRGHVVNGTPICPSSVFADIGLTAAAYIYRKRNGYRSEVPSMALEGLDITHPLVVQSIEQEQTIEVTAKTSIANNWVVEITFKSKNGSSTHEHGGCRVSFGNAQEWQAEWSQMSWFVKARMDALVGSASSGQAHHLLKPVVYKLFQHVVRYSEPYQGLQEVFLDNITGDSVAKVKLEHTTSGGTFTLNPYWSDSIVHLAGFVLNGNTTTPEDTIYISGGLRSMRLAEELSTEKTYTSYVRMKPAATKNYFVGDVYVFDGDNVVAVCDGVMFQALKKTIFNAIIGNHIPSGSKTAKTRPISSPKQQEISLPEQGVAPAADPISDILKIIADQGRISINKVLDDATFADLDIDHMKIIAITSKIRDLMSLNIPTSLFASDATISSLKNYIREEFKPQDLYDNISPIPSLKTSTRATTSTAPSSVSEHEPDMADVLMAAVIAETGVEPDEIELNSLFSDLGVDSLMGIAIIDAVKKETGVMLPASFLNDNPTVGDAKRELRKTEEPARMPTPVVATRTPPPAPIQKLRETSPSAEPLRIDVPDTPAPLPTSSVSKASSINLALVPKDLGASKYSSNVVLLQGRPSSPLTPLFMICDGAGSATAYIHLPSFKTGLPVYALESPFLHCPTEYNVSIEEIALMFKTAIQKVQPHGPYMIGGWSAGAVYAYETTRLLLDDGEAILGLLLLDMRVPRPMPDALEPNMELLEQAGLITGIKRAGRSLGIMSEKLKQHLLSTVKALMVYDPKPMDPARRPSNTFIIWAKIGMSEVIGKGAGLPMEEEPEPKGNIMEDADTGLKSWFYAKRKVFGPNGWDKLVGDVECHAIEADHFSMVTQPAVKLTGALMQDAVAKFTK